MLKELAFREFAIDFVLKENAQYCRHVFLVEGVIRGEDEDIIQVDDYKG